MLVPVFEADGRPRGRPWVSAACAALWLAVFAAGFAAGAPAPDHFGLWPGDPALPGALTFCALHASGVHLAFALALLAWTGPALEDRWGHACFAVFLALATAAGAGALNALAPDAGAAALNALAPDPVRPVVGASAALTALAAAAALRFRRGGLAWRVGFGERRSFALQLPAFALPIAWLAGVVAVRAAESGAEATAGLDLRVQLGAAALGAAWAALLDRVGLEERWRRRGARLAHERAIEAVLAAARGECEADRPDAAWARLAAALETHPDVRIATALLEAGEACGRRGDALALGARAVGEAWHAGRRDVATAIWAPLVRAEPDLPLDLRLRLALAPLLGASGLPREAALTLRGELRGRRRALTPGAALRIADAARTVHPATAIEAARIALESDALDAGKRARIEALIDALETDPKRLVAPELDAEPEPPARARDRTGPTSEGEPEDPHALSLPEAAEALELDAPRAGQTA